MQLHAPSPPAIAWQAFRVGGIAVTASQSRTGRPNLALFHGALGDMRRIAPIAPHLEDCNLAFFDMRGHGRSHRPADGYDIEALAQEMRAPLSAAFGDAPFSILAESFSGVVALALTPLLPAIGRVVLVDTPFDTTRMHASHVALLRAYPRTPAHEQPALAALCDSFFGLDVASGAVTPRRFHRHLADRRAPTTMITGTRKASLEPNAPEPAAYFETTDIAALGDAPDAPAFSVIEIPGGGHRLMKTHLPEVVAALRRVLAATASS